MSDTIKKARDAFDKGNSLYRQNDFEGSAKSFQLSIVLYDTAAKNGESVDQASVLVAKENLSLACNKIGKELLNNSQATEAIEVFKEAVKLNSKSFDANNNLGLAYKKAENWAEAIKSFEAVPMIAGNTLYFYTLYSLAECHKSNNQYSKAIEIFQRSLKYKVKISDTLNAYSKIIESALLANDPAALNQAAKAAFTYAQQVEEKDHDANKPQLNYIMEHSARVFAGKADTAKYLNSVAKLYAKVNPSKTLHSALIDHIYAEYHADKAEPKGKIIKAEHLLGRLVKNIKDSGVIAVVKEAAKLIAQQDDTSKGLVDKIVSVDVGQEGAATILGDMLEGFGKIE